MPVRHRKVLRDNIQGINNQGLKRLLYRAGAKRVSGLSYEELRAHLKVYLEDVLARANTIREYERRKTFSAKDLYTTFEIMGTPLVIAPEKPKNKKKISA